ncbi:hypothetical protein L873DRAFT_184917 [Choiromyces venosus 120613-1]|uniref:Uncharacterized protein n=1 Tax=Choiromyces venosus 120613-1 TaxID=1336337 RepID=A0A3N4J5M3_9PEZI|nr:hypothetical protein L873DRAFT_184917 [Choiromyces venosus 120613-1]
MAKSISALRDWTGVDRTGTAQASLPYDHTVHSRWTECTHFYSMISYSCLCMIGLVPITADMSTADGCEPWELKLKSLLVRCRILKKKNAYHHHHHHHHHHQRITTTTDDVWYRQEAQIIINFCDFSKARSSVDPRRREID